MIKLFHVVNWVEPLEPHVGLIVVRDMRYVFRPARRGVLKPFTSEVHLVLKAFGWWLRITRYSSVKSLVVCTSPAGAKWQVAKGRVESFYGKRLKDDSEQMVARRLRERMEQEELDAENDQ